MSRHRNVRSMNYEDECDYDDVYGHSVPDDDYCVSPSTAAQFMYDRNQQQSFAAFMGRDDEPIPEEDEGETEESLNDSSNFSRPSLPQRTEVQLNACLEQMTNILGDSISEHLMIEAAVNFNYNAERAVDYLLNQQESMKPQRQPRERRNRAGRGSSTQDTPAMPQTDDNVTTDTPQVVTHDLPQQIARMTFSSGGQTRTGFEPVSVNGEAEGKQPNSHADKEAGSDRIPAPSNVGERGDSDRSPNRLASESAASGSANPNATPSKRSKQDKIDLKKEYEKRKAGGKEYINLVVIGHVDAGKSTLMGHVLYQLGFVNKRTMHKYEQEAKKLGKASFAYAWVLDETEEERTRGVTMDIAQTRFETDSKVVTLLDAPGHKDFIPNMITGAAQADVAILVVNATRGEFETGFEAGGQTREHAMLIRSLGVSQLVVAVNKMDTVEWSQERYNEITKKLGQFLQKQAGFREGDLRFTPCSGLSGVNLTQAPTDEALKAWYQGPTLIQLIDKFKPPERQIDKPLRMCVSDVYKGMGAGFCVSGTIQAGCLQTNDRLLVMPQAETLTVKGITIDDLSSLHAFAGDNVVLTVTGMEMMNIGIGSILCDPLNPMKAATRFQARVVIFNIEVPLTKGFPVVFHYQSMSEPAHIRKLVSQLHKSSGEVVRKRPRCLAKNSNAVIELELGRPVCLELYKDYKDLGRFMLRYAGSTIAAGLVTEILPNKAAKAEG